jgi:hypothetical protein
MNDADREALVEAVASSFRARDLQGSVKFHPAWLDLDAAGRHEAAEAARAERRIEALLDPEGLSSTARAVLRRIRER